MESLGWWHFSVLPAAAMAMANGPTLFGHSWVNVKILIRRLPAIPMQLAEILAALLILESVARFKKISLREAKSLFRVFWITFLNWTDAKQFVLWYRRGVPVIQVKLKNWLKVDDELNATFRAVITQPFSPLSRYCADPHIANAAGIGGLGQDFSSFTTHICFRACLPPVKSDP